MGFWSTTEAVPSWMSVAMAAWIPPTPGYLRPEPPPLPNIPPPYSIRHLKCEDAAAIASLWRDHYGGEDWWFDADEAVVLPYLRDPRVVVLGLYEDGASLVATIAAVPLGETTMSHGARLREFYVVEGLVVRGDLRGKGVAGWMIAAIDGTMCRYTGVPFACLWAREIPTIPSFPTFVSCRPYFWIECLGSNEVVAEQAVAEQAVAEQAVAELTAEAFQPIWDALQPDGPFVRSVRIDNRRGGLRFFKVGDAGYAVISDTRRRTKAEGHHLYEIVGASSAAAVAVAALPLKQHGLLFTTMDMTGRQGWKGGAGYHAYSMYNYRPPCYGTCEILAIREEL